MSALGGVRSRIENRSSLLRDLFSWTEMEAIEMEASVLKLQIYMDTINKSRYNGIPIVQIIETSCAIFA